MGWGHENGCPGLAQLCSWLKTLARRPTALCLDFLIYQIVRFELDIYTFRIMAGTCVCAQSYPTLWNPRGCSLPGSSVQISQARLCSGLPFSIPGDLPNPGIKAVSPVSPALAGDSLPLCPLGSQWLAQECLI